MTDVHGHCDLKFRRVRELLEENTTSGEEIGASICVSVADTNVVDIWGGYKDVKRSQAWEKDTLVLVWSTSKCVTSLAALILMERGMLDPYGKVCVYWPEFAENGKEDSEVRHLMSHTAGLPAWEESIALKKLYNVGNGAALLAKQKPWWTPGTASGYHAVTQGHLMGELIRHITGKSLRQFVKEEIADRLKADFHIGAPEHLWGRIAELLIPQFGPVSSPVTQFDPKSVIAKVIARDYFKEIDPGSPGFRSAELGACNGFGNARAMVRALSPISLGGIVDGRKFLSPETLDTIFDEQCHAKDLVLLNYLRWGI